MRRTLIHLLLLSTLAPSIAGADDCETAYWDSSDSEGYAKCEAAAYAGDPVAQFGYAQIMWSGNGRESHREQAIEWYRRAAKQGHRFAQLALGMFLSDERSPVVRNPIEAYAWYAVLDEHNAMRKIASSLLEPDLKRAQALAKDYIDTYRKALPKPTQPNNSLNPTPESYAPFHAEEAARDS